jgi:hypothetical protein
MQTKHEGALQTLRTVGSYSCPIFETCDTLKNVPVVKVLFPQTVGEAIDFKEQLHQFTL